MESLYARDTPKALEHKLKLADGDPRIEKVQAQETSNDEPQSMETFDSSTISTKCETNAIATKALDSITNSPDQDIDFNFVSLRRNGKDETRQPLNEWHMNSKTQQSMSLEQEAGEDISKEPNKTEEGRLAELSEDSTSSPSFSASSSGKIKTAAAESCQEIKQEGISAVTSATLASQTTSVQPRQAGVVSAPCKTKTSITINTGLSSGGVGCKRPPHSPVSPPKISWSDILRVQNMIERCLQQYLSKSDILIILKGQANVDPAFTNVVWQKLVEQNPNFFRAYSLQLQLKEQIIAFNYLVSQQKEMMANGAKRVRNYSDKNRPWASPASASNSCALITSSTTSTLLPINLAAQTFQQRSTKRQRTPVQNNGRQHMNMDKLGSSSVGSDATSMGLAASTMPSPLPLPSPIKTDLDTHAFFT